MFKQSMSGHPLLIIKNPEGEKKKSLNLRKSHVTQKRTKVSGAGSKNTTAPEIYCKIDVSRLEMGFLITQCL